MVSLRLCLAFSKCHCTALDWKSLVDVAVKTLQTGQRIPVVF